MVHCSSLIAGHSICIEGNTLSVVLLMFVGAITTWRGAYLMARAHTEVTNVREEHDYFISLLAKVKAGSIPLDDIEPIWRHYISLKRLNHYH